MKEKIEKLSKGIFLYEQPDIILSQEELLLTMETGTILQGSFLISNGAKNCMKGILYSSNPLFIIEDEKFIGEENIINYKISSEYVDSGDIISGEVSIITDCGECGLPFSIKVEAPSCNTIIGKVRDLFQFTNLVKTDWADAKKLFKSDDFKRILMYYDKKYANLYKYLRCSSSGSQALEEFLIAIHKKVPIRFMIDKTNLEYKAADENFMDRLKLTKEGWGYAELRISTDASFIDLERKILWADNFVGNSCELGFVIKCEALKTGRHFGRIYIKNVHQQIAVDVVCHVRANSLEKQSDRRKEQFYDAKLTDNYLKFRMNKISSGRYMQEAENLLLAYEVFSGDSILHTLYRIHVQLVCGKESLAKAAISELAERKKEMLSTDIVAYAGLLYLETLVKKGSIDIEAVCQEIRNLYDNNKSEWRIFWFLLYLDRHYDTNKRQKLDDIRTQFLLGCRSPILYYEAAFLLNDTPSLLKELSLFEWNVIYFGLKYRYLSKDAMVQMTYLAGKEKAFTRIAFQVLSLAYDRFKLKDTLTAICTLLIRGHKLEPQYFFWYHLGVEQQLRVTELQEYYLYSMDEDVEQPLDSSILLYFSYQNKLHEKKKAYLYANIIRHKDTNMQIYHTYEADIRSFALQQLRLNNMNRFLGVIYDEVLQKTAIDEETAMLIPQIAFRYELECNNTFMKSVGVVHKEQDIEIITPLVEGKALVDIYTENAEIFLIDIKDKRYSATVDYTLNKLIHAEDLLIYCWKFNKEDNKLLLNLSEKAQSYQKFDIDSVELRKRVTELEHLNEEYARSYIRTLIYHYYDSFEGELLEYYLLKIDLHGLEQNDRMKLIEFMIIRDMYDTALDRMKEFGYEGIDVKRLLKFCSRIIADTSEQLEADCFLLRICYIVFQSGKYDENILKYLVKFYNDTTSKMYEVWSAAFNFEVNTEELEERLLGQMLFAESYLENSDLVFLNYFHIGCNRKLIQAFLNYVSFRYLIKGRILSPSIFEVVEQEINFKENEICLLALLRFLSTKESLVEKEEQLIDYWLKILLKNGVVLPFFKEFSQNLEVAKALHDRYFVEYQTVPGRKVMIHYTVAEDINPSAFVEESMDYVCYGIFVKEFVLFCNETLQYYISEEIDGRQWITESTEVTIEAENGGIEGSKFDQLNFIITANTMKEDAAVLELLEGYARTEYEISHLFQPI